MSLCIVKDNSESFAWYEYLIGSKQTICEQRDFKSETGLKLRGMMLPDSL